MSGTSLDVDPTFMIEPDDVVRAVFYGLGSDGTVGANKNSVKILAEDAGPLCAGLLRLRFAQVGRADRVAPSLRATPDSRPLSDLFGELRRPAISSRSSSRLDVLRLAAPSATFLLNSPYEPEETWDHLPRSVQQEIIDKQLRLFVIDASKVARDAGLGGRINTMLQTCFFAISGVLPRDEAIAAHQAHRSRRPTAARAARSWQRNFAAVDADAGSPARGRRTASRDEPLRAPADRARHRAGVRARRHRDDAWPGAATRFRSARCRSTARFPSGTAAWEKRNVADEVPVWEPDLCIQCGQCRFVCPHRVIRARYYDAARLNDLDGAPATFKSAPINARGYPDVRFTLQFYVEDCTGCGLCVEVCPAHSPRDPDARRSTWRRRRRCSRRSAPTSPSSNACRSTTAHWSISPMCAACSSWSRCSSSPAPAPAAARRRICRLLSQLFGDRLQIANATGCSSIYGGNLPVTPWTTNREGRGPAWSNSLFEDNAEFGLGFRLAADKHVETGARAAARTGAASSARPLVEAILAAPQIRESEILAQRGRVAELKRRLTGDGRRARARSICCRWSIT